MEERVRLYILIQEERTMLQTPRLIHLGAVVSRDSIIILEGNCTRVRGDAHVKRQSETT